MAEDRFEELLGSYLLGELTVEEERELEGHLEGCSGCRSELNRVLRSHEHLRKLAASEPPQELKARVLEQVRGEPQARSRGRWWFKGLAAAAALVVVAVLGIGLLQDLTDDSSTGVPLSATALAPADAGGEVQVERVGQNIEVDLEVWGMPELGGRKSTTRCGTTPKMAAGSAAEPSGWDRGVGLPSSSRPLPPLGIIRRSR